MATSDVVGGVPFGAGSRIKGFLDHDGVLVPVFSASPVGEQCLDLFRFLSDDGTSSGVKVATGNYSVSEEIFYIQPPAGKVYQLTRMIVTMQDTTMQWGQYGGIGALGTGVVVRVVDDGGTIIDITYGVPVDTNGSWGARCFDAEISAPAAGSTFFHCRWTFALAGQKIRLDGDGNNERLEVVLNDDFSGLLAHGFQVHGYDETVKT